MRGLSDWLFRGALITSLFVIGFFGQRLVSEFDDQKKINNHRWATMQSAISTLSHNVDLLKQAMEFRRAQRDGEIQTMKDKIAEEGLRLKAVEDKIH